MRVLRWCYAAVILSAMACSRPDGAVDETANGPRIPIDTGALRSARQRLAWEDSARRRADTTKRSREDRAFLLDLRQAQVLGDQETLARLGYGVLLSGELDAQTRRAFKSFARYHGLHESGDSLTPELQVALDYAANHSFSPFSLQDLRVEVNTWTDVGFGAVHAWGTWSPADPPRQTSNIWCYRNLRVCRETVAYILMGNLYTDEIEYAIERWDNDELIARSNSLCMADKLTIDRAEASAILVRSARGDELQVCKTLRKATPELVARLVDGKKITDSLNAEGAAFERLGPKAVALWQRLRAAAGPKP